MLTKNEFIKYMEEIDKYNKQCDRVNNALTDVSWDYTSLSLGSNLVDALVELLEKTMSDNSETISWWLYEAPKDDKRIWVTDDDAKEEKEYILDTVEDLYNYLNQFAKLAK